MAVKAKRTIRKKVRNVANSDQIHSGRRRKTAALSRSSGCSRSSTGYLRRPGGLAKDIVIHSDVSLQGTILYSKWLSAMSPSTPVNWQASVSIGH